MRTAAVLLAWAAAVTAAHAAPDGAAMYAQHCAVCHLPDGAGQAGLAPPLKGGHWARLGAERRYLPTVLVHGLAGAIKIDGQTFVGVMASFGGQFDDATLAALATHVRRLQGATDAAAYAPEEIRSVRDTPGNAQATLRMRREILGQ